MKDKLYSRWRIRIPNLRELNSLKAILLILFFSIVIVIVVFLKMAYPVFKASCETTAGSKGNEIINEEVNKVMRNYTYDSIINIDKDTNGKITLIEANTVVINQIVTKIIGNIQNEFDKLPRITVYINMGAVSGISVLKNIKPNLDIELESAGNINSTTRTEFSSVGINQTHHKIYLDINACVGILTPFDTFRKEINTEVLLTEAIIVGEVPDTYYNLEGLEDPTDTYNFVQ